MADSDKIPTDKTSHKCDITHPIVWSSLATNRKRSFTDADPISTNQKNIPSTDKQINLSNLNQQEQLPDISNKADKSASHHPNQPGLQSSQFTHQPGELSSGLADQPLDLSIKTDTSLRDLTEQRGIGSSHFINQPDDMSFDLANQRYNQFPKEGGKQKIAHEQEYVPFKKPKPVLSTFIGKKQSISNLDQHVSQNSNIPVPPNVCQPAEQPLSPQTSGDMSIDEKHIFHRAYYSVSAVLDSFQSPVTPLSNFESTQTTVSQLPSVLQQAGVSSSQQEQPTCPAPQVDIATAETPRNPSLVDKVCEMLDIFQSPMPSSNSESK